MFVHSIRLHFAFICVYLTFMVFLDLKWVYTASLTEEAVSYAHLSVCTSCLVIMHISFPISVGVPG